MERVVMYVLRKFCVALLASFIQGLFFLIISVIGSFSEANSAYSAGPVWAFALVSQFYSIPAYVLAGIPSSMLIEAGTDWMKIHSNTPRYLIRVILYAVTGILIVALYQHLSQTGTVVYVEKPSLVSEGIRLIVSGGLPALLFYHTSLLLRWARIRTRH